MTEATIPSATLTELIELFKAREAAGMVKYGTTIDRDDLSLADWLQHALEESMDKPIYLMRAIKKLRASQPAEQPRGEPVASAVVVKDGDIGRFTVWLPTELIGETVYVYRKDVAQPKPEQAVGDGVIGYVHPALLDGNTLAIEVSRVRLSDAQLPVYITPRPAVATPAEVTDEQVRSLAEAGRLHTLTEEQWEAWRTRASLTAQCQVRKDTQGLDDSGRLTPGDERPTFESWVRDHFKYPRLDIDPCWPGFYADLLTAGAWEAWQKRASLASPSAGAAVPGEMLFERQDPTSTLSTFVLDGRYVVESRDYARGWNACRKAMLAASGAVKDGDK